MSNDDKKRSRSSSRPARHSKQARKPVTIEGSAKDVTKAKDKPDAAKADAKPASRRSVPKSGSTAAASAKDNAKSEAASTKIETTVKAAPKSEEPAKSAAAATSAAKEPAAKAEPAKAAGAAKVEPQSGKTTAPKPDDASLRKPASPSSTEKPSAVPKSPPAPPPPPPRQSMFVPALTGGVVALLLAGLLQYAGVLGSFGAGSDDGDQQIAALNARIAALETGGTSATDEAQTALTAMQLRLQQLENALEEARSAAAAANPAGASTEALAGMEGNVDALSKRLDELSSAMSSAPSGGADPVVAERIAALESRLTAAEDAGQTGRNALDSRVDAAESTALVAVQQAQAATQAIESIGIGTIRDSLQALNGQVNELTAARNETNAAITAMQDRLANGADRRAAAAIAAAALKDAIDSGGAFRQPLETLRGLSAQSEGLDTLEPYAESGVPTRIALQQHFSSGVSDAILGALTPEPEEGVMNRLFSATRSMVKVRPLDATEGDSPAALVSQITAHLKDGKLADASGVWQNLPEASKAASADWHTDLTARLEADRIVSSAVQRTLDATTQSGTDG